VFYHRNPLILHNAPLYSGGDFLTYYFANDLSRGLVCRLGASYDVTCTDFIENFEQGALAGKNTWDAKSLPLALFLSSVHQERHTLHRSYLP